MRSLELFAGAGGLGLGLHSAGFHPEGVIERDSHCCNTILENKQRGPGFMRDWTLVSSDVREIKFGIYEDKLDLVSGGPPCQPFSLGGKHAAYEDSRDMFPQAVRAVRQIRPSAFIFENVKGLTRDRFQNYFEYIKLQLEHPTVEKKPGEEWTEHHNRLEKFHTAGKRPDLHYRVVTRLLNAADFGIPQRRERVFFVGFRDDLNIEWAFPKPTHSKESLLWDQSSHGTYWDRHRISKSTAFYLKQDKMLGPKPLFASPELPWLTVRDALYDLPAPDTSNKAKSGFSSHRLQPGARAYPGHTGSKLDEPAKALKAGVHGVPGGENMMVHSNGSVRYFTIREAARLQTFPDDFVFASSWSETMRQLGNAVPVGLASVVGRSVAAQLELALPTGMIQ